jgi:hypothetical protein
MREKITRLFILTIIPVALVAFLYFRSTGFGVQHKNGFDRRFADKAYVIYRHELPYNSYYLAGATSSTIYLGNRVGTTKLVEGDSTLSQFKESDIHFPAGKNIAWEALQLNIDSPDVYASELVTPSWYEGNMNEQELHQIQVTTDATSATLAIAPGKYVLRMYDSTHDQYDLFNRNKQIIKSPIRAPLLQKHGDGTFSLDGILLYDKTEHLVVYVYYYRNLISIFDTALNEIAEMKTIDTVSIPDVQVANIASTNTSTLRYPATVINKKAAVCNNRLYIHSMRKADNQTQTLQSVIDCYDISQQQYLFSFYVPADPKILSGIMVKAGRMYAIAGTELLALRLVP